MGGERSQGSYLAYFYYPTAPRAAPGVASCSPAAPAVSAHGSMNHVAFSVPRGRVADYRRVLKGRGVQVSPLLSAPFRAPGTLSL